MNREDTLAKMRDSVGTKDPIEYFKSLTDVLTALFDKVDSLEKSLQKTQINTVMLMGWDKSVAAKMVGDELAFLRTNGKQPDGTNMYQPEIDALTNAGLTGVALMSYPLFVKFWQDLLGYHPFLEARR